MSREEVYSDNPNLFVVLNYLAGNLWLPFLLIMLAMSVPHRWSSGSQTSAIFDTPEECFWQRLHYTSLWQSFLSQLDPGDTADTYPGMLQPQSCSSSHNIFCWIYVSCGFGTAATNSSSHKPLFSLDSPGSCCWPLTSPKFAADSQGCFTGTDTKTPPAFIPFLKEVPRADEITCFEEPTQQNETCPQPKNT